jgi:hypothetical protein
MSTLTGVPSSYPLFGVEPIVISGVFYDVDQYNPTLAVNEVLTTNGYSQTDSRLAVRNSGDDTWSPTVTYKNGQAKLPLNLVIPYPSGSGENWFIFNQSPARTKGAWETVSLELKRVI